MILAIIPVAIMGGVHFISLQFHESWANISVKLVLAAVVVIYVAGLLRAIHHGTTSYRVFRLSGDELNIGLAYFLMLGGFAVIFIVGEPFVESMGDNRLIPVLILLTLLNIFLLRMVLVAPVIVLENRNTFCAFAEAWQRTKWQTPKLVAVALVSLLPPLFGLDLLISLIFQVEAADKSLMYALVIMIKYFLSYACLVLFATAVYKTYKTWADMPELDERT